MEAVDRWRSGVYVCLKGEEVLSGRSVKGSRRRRGRRGGYLSGVITDRVSHSSNLLSSHNQLFFPSEAVRLVSCSEGSLYLSLLSSIDSVAAETGSAAASPGAYSTVSSGAL